MDQDNSEQPDSEQAPARGLRLRTLVIMLAIAASVPIALVGWISAWNSFLELGDPIIRFIDPPRGVGVTPVPVQIRVEDPGTGLSEIVVGLRQRDAFKELLRRELRGEHLQTIALDLDGAKFGLDETLGPVTIEVHARDRAIWKNRSAEEMTLAVDFQKPQLELLSSRFAAKVGGSQMILYRAIDENLAFTGVKYAGRVFFGERASGIDPDLKETGLYVCVFGVDSSAAGAEAPRLFAEDNVGNAASAAVPLAPVVLPSDHFPVIVEEDLMRTDLSRLADLNVARLRDIEGTPPNAELFKSAAGSEERLIEKFKLVAGPLRMYNESELLSRLAAPRQEALWNGPFVFPSAKNQPGFGDELRYTYHGQDLGAVVQSGMEIPARADASILAANDGIVILSDNIGVYGRIVAVDHGLGVVTVYGHLESSSVKRGDTVSKGQPIGSAGKTGFARTRGAYYELRVQGVPVDPLEWSDPTWFYANITAKVDEARKKLGLPIYKPLK